MLNWFLKADKGADLAVRWFGVYAVLSAVYTWLARQAPRFADFHWAELVLLSVAAALLTILLIAASLALFRYFRPLSAASANAETQIPEDEDLGRRQRRLEANHGNHVEHLHKFEESLGTLAGSMGAIEKRLDDRAQKLEQRLGTLEGAIMKRFQQIDGLVGTQDQYLRRQVASLYQALAAIYHREQLAALAEAIEAGAAELAAPTTMQAHYDADQWEQWETKRRAWKGVLQQWCSLAGSYAPDTDIRVLEIHPDQLQQRGQAKAEQFPDAEAFIDYKTFWIQLKQFRDWRAEAERAVHQAAFNGATTSERPVILGSGDGKGLFGGDHAR